METWGKNYRPAVSRDWLWLIAGILWSLVGLALCTTACYWLSMVEWPWGGVGAGIGFGAGIPVYRFGFSRIARKNADRIAQQPATVCLFAFQAWRSYGLIIIMMILGYLLRHSGLPRLIVAGVYAAVGTGLTLSSSIYYERFF